jgi:CheY-like chemotaxis protein
MRIWLVENDPAVAALITAELQQATEACIETIRTEFEFRDAFTHRVLPQPNVVILDVMLPWTVPGPNLIEPPDEVRKGRHFRAGFRCFELLRSRSQVPVIFYTGVSRDIDLLPGSVYFYLPKDITDLRPLSALVCRLLTRHGRV